MSAEWANICNHGKPVEDEKMKKNRITICPRSGQIYVTTGVSPWMMKVMKWGALGVLLLVWSCSVSYKLDGASINYDLVKTIQIRDFPNRAPLVYPPLSQVFDRALRDRYIEQTRLKAVSNNADINLEGEITGYDISNTAITADAYASKTRLTITVKVRYINNKNPKENVDQSFSAFQEYDSTKSLDEVQDQLIKLITTDLVDMIFNATVANW